MKVFLTKTNIGLVPADTNTTDWFNRLKAGEVVKADFKKVRNYAFLRKYFALLNVAYDNWTPGPVDSKYGPVEKNFDRFRADVTILAGYYDVTVRLDGSTRIEPKSISFAKMDEESFSELYSKTIDVLLKFVYNSGITGDELNRIVEQYMSFV